MSTWQEEYDAAIQNPPKVGDILVAAEGMVLLTIELKDGSPPFIFSKVNVSEIVGTTPKWYLQSEHDEYFHGWRCILLPKARGDLAKKFGLSQPTMLVKSLRVIHYSQSKKSLLCEVHKYGDENQPQVKENEPEENQPEKEEE